MQVVVGAADVGNAVLHRAKGFDDALGRDAQPVVDAGVQRIFGDGLVGVALPAAAEDHAAAFGQAQRRHPQALHTLQRKVQKGRKTDDACGHAVLRIVLQRRQGAEGVELVLALAHRAQRPEHLGWRRVAHQVLVGVGGAHAQALVGLVGVDQVVGRRAAGHAARLHHVVHHAPGVADGEGVEEHLRLLPRRARGGEVQRHGVFRHRQHLVLLEEVGMHRRQGNEVVQRGQRIHLHALLRQQRAVPGRALLVPAREVAHGGDELRIGVRFRQVGRGVGAKALHAVGHRSGAVTRVAGDFQSKSSGGLENSLHTAQNTFFDSF